MLFIFNITSSINKYHKLVGRVKSINRGMGKDRAYFLNLT